MNLLLSHGNSYEQWVSGICEMWKEVLSIFLSGFGSFIQLSRKTRKKVFSKGVLLVSKHFGLFKKVGGVFEKVGEVFWKAGEVF